MPITVNRHIVPSALPSPPVQGLQAWVAKPLPVSLPGSIIMCNYGSFNTLGQPGGGKKHGTMFVNPLDSRIYVFGGDGAGNVSQAEKDIGIARGNVNGLANDDFRNDEWSYDPLTNNWRLEKGWECADGKQQPWRPDWGCFAWDTTRNVVWWMPGGSNGAWGGGANAPFYIRSKSGLNLTLNQAQFIPDLTIVPVTTLPLVDNATNYVEYNFTTHALSSNTTGFSGAANTQALWQVPTSGGTIGTQVDMRPYWMRYGDTAVDKIPFTKYFDPQHIIYRNMTTGDWTDPGYFSYWDANAADPANFPMDVSSGGSRYPHESRNYCMIHDPTVDQLVCIGAQSGPTSAVLHFNIATQTWLRVKTNVPSTQLNQAIYTFVNADRKIYAIEASSDDNPIDHQSSCGWTYDVDKHTFSTPIPVPDCQKGTCLWPGHGYNVGDYIAGGYSFAQIQLDAANDIIWYPETTNSLLCPYGYENDGWLQVLHAWHYKENRFEVITPPDAPEGHTHGIQHCFDYVHNLYLMYGENSGNNANPAHYTQYMYMWTPSGFSKPTWSTMP